MVYQHPGCVFEHDVSVLTGVESMPVSKLPEICPLCGEPFRYAEEVLFVNQAPAQTVHDEIRVNVKGYRGDEPLLNEDLKAAVAANQDKVNIAMNALSAQLVGQANRLLRAATVSYEGRECLVDDSPNSTKK